MLSLYFPTIPRTVKIELGRFSFTLDFFIIFRIRVCIYNILKFNQLTLAITAIITEQRPHSGLAGLRFSSRSKIRRNGDDPEAKLMH